jgi:hypothetical protein
MHENRSTEQTAPDRRAELADIALAVYAGVAAALAGEAGYQALRRWCDEQRGETTHTVEL